MIKASEKTKQAFPGSKRGSPYCVYFYPFPDIVESQTRVEGRRVNTGMCTRVCVCVNVCWGGISGRAGWSGGRGGC